MDALDKDPLFHGDYHANVRRQVWAEWGARGCVAFTLGNGTVGFAATLAELQLLGLALCPEHVTAASYFIDCAIVAAFQVRAAHNRLHDPALQPKVKRALSGVDEDASEEEPASPKQKKSKHGKKGTKDAMDMKKQTGEEESEADG